MTADVERYRCLARVRAEQLADEEDALRRTLFWVRVAGWPLLVAALVSPVAAGSASLSSFGAEDTIVPAVSFLGAAAIALHRGLNCESYQAALKRMVQAVRSIMEDFEPIAAMPDGEVAEAFRKAEARLRELRRTAIDLPAKRRRSFEAVFSAASASCPPG